MATESEENPTKKRATGKTLFPRVLIMGSETPERAQLAELVRMHSFLVEELGGSIGALQLIQEKGLNTVVIMDQLDGMRQDDAVQLLRDHPSTEDITIIALTDPSAEPPQGAHALPRSAGGEPLIEMIIDLLHERNERSERKTAAQ